MVIAFAVFPYLIGGIVMWFVAHQVAPIGRTISLCRAVFAVALMGCSCAAADYFLQPLIGSLHLVADVAISALIALWLFQLTFWRSVLAVVVYWTVWVVADVAMAVVLK